MESHDQLELVTLSSLPVAALVVLSLALVVGVGLACWGVRHEA